MAYTLPCLFGTRVINGQETVVYSGDSSQPPTTTAAGFYGPATRNYSGTVAAGVGQLFSALTGTNTLVATRTNGD